MDRVSFWLVNFLIEIEKELEKNGLLDQYYEDGEYFSRCLEMMAKAQTIEEKQALWIIFKEYSKGELKIIEGWA